MTYPATDDRQVAWGLPHVAAGLLVAIASSVVIGTIILIVGDLEPPPSGPGAMLGRTAGQLPNGGDLDDGGLPIEAIALLQIPLWVGTLGAPVWAVRRFGSSWTRDLGLRFKLGDVGRGLGIGVLTQLVAVPLLYLPILLLFEDQDVSGPARDLTNKAQGVGVVLLVLVVVVGAPLVEELFFRGFVLRALERTVSAPIALAVSSVLFGAVHLQLLQLPALVLFGGVAGYLAQRTGRLGPAIWAHVGFNGTTILLLLVI